MRLTQRVRRGVEIDARLFLNIDSVACGYLRCESAKGVLHFKTNTPETLYKCWSDNGKMMLE